MSSAPLDRRSTATYGAVGRNIESTNARGILDNRRTDIDRKGADGLWVLHPFDAGQAVHLASVGLDIGAEQLFAEVDSPAAG